MKWLTLERIKLNSRIDGSDEDTLLQSYGESAETTVLNYMNRTYRDLLDHYGSVPEPVVQASLMLVDVWYNHRVPAMAVSMSMVPYTFDLMIKPYICLTGGSTGSDDVQVVTVGSDQKITFAASLPDDMTLADVDFTGKVYNADLAADAESEISFSKSDCIADPDNEGAYIVMVDTDILGVGTYLLRLTVLIPDTDYQSGYRREVIKIDPGIRAEA